MIRHTYGWLLASLLVLPFGCSGEDTSSMGGEDFAGPNNTDNPPSTGIGQGGGQDFGLFRQILEAGALPGLGTLDAIGFFAEHKLDYPAANCGEDICVHPLLGVGLDFFNQAPFYLLQIGMNSPLKPNEMEKPPLNLVLSIDVSGSMAGESLDAVKRGLRRMLPGLRPQDKLSIVTYSDEAEVLFQGMTIASQGTLTAAVELLQPLGGTNIYDGLFVAYQVALEQRAEGDETRVLLLSDGMITQGIPDPTRLLTLATAHARQGIGLTTIGVGREFDVDLMRGLSEVGAGGFYFLENPSAVDEVFLQEIQTFMVPVALNARLEVKVDEGHRVRGAYGVRGWDNGVRSGGVSMPVLFLAGRQSAGEPTGEGRRGGGGGIFVEISAAEGEAPLIDAEVTLSWIDPGSGESRQRAAQISAAVDEGLYFSSQTVEKGFVVLNLFLAFQRAVALNEAGDRGAALGILEAVEVHTEGWLAAREDADVEDDLQYVRMFQRNLKGAGINTPVLIPAR